MDTLYVASGCLCALIIELAFKQRLSLMTMMRWYLPCIAAMIFLMHFYGDSLSQSYLNDQNYQYVYMTIQTKDQYRYANIEDKETFKGLMKCLLNDYPYLLPEWEGVTIDVTLEKTNMNYEFTLKEEDFETLLSSSSLLKTVYYHQGLTYDTCILADHMILQDHEGAYHVYFGDTYRRLVENLDAVFNDENMDWASYHESKETVLVSLYMQNTLLKEVTSLDSHHPLVQMALSEDYDQPELNLLVNQAYDYLEDHEDLHEEVSQETLIYDVVALRPEIYNSQLLSASHEEVSLLVPCDIFLALETGSEFVEYSHVYLTFHLENQQAVLDSIRFNESFYQQYGR